MNGDAEMLPQQPGCYYGRGEMWVRATKNELTEKAHIDAYPQTLSREPKEWDKCLETGKMETNTEAGRELQSYQRKG